MPRFTIAILGLYCLAGATLLLSVRTSPAAQAATAGPGELQIEQLEAPRMLQSLVESRRWSDVLKLASEQSSRAPRDPAWPYWVGVSHFYQREFVPAALSLRSAERLGLNSASLHHALGIVYYALHQHILFLQQMDLAAKVDPDNPMTFHYLGRYYEHDASDYLKAIACFDQALERDPDDVKSLSFRAFCFQMLGRTAEAQSGYEAAIRRVEAGGRRIGWPYQKLAELLLPNDPHLALSFARKAVEFEPSLESNHLVLAKVYESIGNREAAIEECLQAVRLAPNDASIRYLLFRLYKSRGDAAGAAEQLRIHEKLRAIYVAKQ
jgi:tetratricopeptide (TPR) repeat protein